MEPSSLILEIAIRIKSVIPAADFNYIEFGIDKGITFNIISPHFQRGYAVDVNDCKPYIIHNQNLNWFQMSTEAFCANILPFERILFSVAFIDAWHSYQSVVHDFQNLLPYIVDNGFIFLHDTYPKNDVEIHPNICNDAYKAADYIKRHFQKNCELITVPGGYGLSIIRKASRTLLWKKY